MAKATKKEILVSLDVEKAGMMPLKNPIVSIGHCVGDLDGNILDKGRHNMTVQWPVEKDFKTNEADQTTIDIKDSQKMDYGDFEPICYEEFWSKQPPALIGLLQDTNRRSFNKCIRLFVNWLNALEQQYPEDTHTIRFLSNNPNYDFGAIDSVLEREVGRLPARCSTSGKYRSCTNPKNMLDMLPDNLRATYDKKITAMHDHDPANDAEYVYRMYLVALDAKKDLGDQKLL